MTSSGILQSDRLIRIGFLVAWQPGSCHSPAAMEIVTDRRAERDGDNVDVYIIFVCAYMNVSLRACVCMCVYVCVCS